MSGPGSVVVSPISGTWIWSRFSPLTLGRVTDSLVLIGIGAAGWCSGSSRLWRMAWWARLCLGASPEGLVRLCSRLVALTSLFTSSLSSVGWVEDSGQVTWSETVQIFRWTVLNLVAIWPWRVSNISVMFGESSGELCLWWWWCFLLLRQWACRHHPTCVAESKKMANLCGHVRVLIGYQTWCHLLNALQNCWDMEK